MYRKIRQGEPSFERIKFIQSIGQWICDSWDHNEEEGCSNPECFKYQFSQAAKKVKNMVTVEIVLAKSLEAKIQEAKDSGRRILALSPSTFKKVGKTTANFQVTHYALATQ
jgi:hypothetical protein